MKKFAVALLICVPVLSGALTAQASDGDLDSSWGGTGIVISTHATISSSSAVATDSNDRVLTVGWVADGPSSRIIVSRFLSNGLPDNTCNNTGEYVDHIQDAVASDIVVLADDSFVITGTMQINNKSTLFVTKFSTTCSPDTGFGSSGLATYTSAIGTSGRALTIRSDGRIIVVGDEFPSVSDSSDQRLLVARFTSSGVLDNTFGSNGRFISAPNRVGQAQDVILDANDRIVFVGSIDGTSAPDAAIVGRLTSAGQLDTSFAIQGYFSDEFNGDPRLNAISMRPNGKFVAVGTYEGPYPSTQQSALVVCLTNSGILDNECGANGWIYLSATNSDVYGDDVVVTADNSILLSGMRDGITAAPMVMRLDHSGSRDTSFAAGGTWLGSGLAGRMYSISIQDDGRILSAGGIEVSGLLSLTVVRLNNTVTAPPTIVPITTTVATTTIAPAPPTSSVAVAYDQLPATGNHLDALIAALFLFFVGAIIIGVRRRILS